MKTAPILIFDLDGTLVDSLGDLHTSSNLLLAELGFLPLELPVLQPCIGRGVQYLVRCMLMHAERIHERGSAYGDGEAVIAEGGAENHAAPLRDRRGNPIDIDATVARYREIYRAHAMDTTMPYPGVPETLEALGAYRMAVLSNKPAAASTAILEALDLAHYFTFVAGGDSFPAMKPSPVPVHEIMRQLGAERTRTWMVGDSVYDIEAGKAAGAGTVAVTYGFQPEEKLKALEPDYTVSAFKELLNIFNRGKTD